ncbi:type-2 ice-structuring protein [Hyalella azteca]|uniref:Type-2 ice-structuring protein n=1 Tax=Hyalella azteca TaxID=294128 RepID=A0A8B7PER1_HYAAZ|nr:type-2 ice-structuring protein [Hyalella azteca]
MILRSVREDEATKCKDDASDDDEGATSEPEPSPEPTLPPPPETCPAPFQLLAESCYYIQTDPREWKSWGEAQSFCQQQAGTLAAPHRPNQLRDYLNTYYSNVFWVGGRKDRGQWVWLNGNGLSDDDWKTGKPDRHPSKMCLQLDASSSYKGVNHFCGEKFSFICEHRQG